MKNIREVIKSKTGNTNRRNVPTSNWLSMKSESFRVMIIGFVEVTNQRNVKNKLHHSSGYKLLSITLCYLHIYWIINASGTSTDDSFKGYPKISAKYEGLVNNTKILRRSFGTFIFHNLRNGGEVLNKSERDCHQIHSWEATDRWNFARSSTDRLS